MRKVLIFSIALISCFLLGGCGKYGEQDIVKDLTKKINNSKAYHLNGVLEIINNEDSYLYDVDVSYQNEDKFRVSLKNQTNNHEQIILKNNDGVYVLTPSLNKSFKFQSEWPYNNSQSYLLQTILSDITNDSNRQFSKTENGYMFLTAVNYSNNKELVKQKVYINKDLVIEKVEVLNNSDQSKMTMNFTNIDLKATFSDNYFDLKTNMEVSATSELETPVSKIEESIYPMYIPTNTFLSGEEKNATNSGERVILTFSGEVPFMVVQETVSISEKYLTIPVYGEPFMLTDTIGSLSDTSVNWISNGIEYYVVSSKASQEDLITIANSIGVMSVVASK